MRTVMVRISSFSLRLKTARSAFATRSASFSAEARNASSTAMPSDVAAWRTAVSTNWRSVSRSRTTFCWTADSSPLENENEPTGSIESPNWSSRIAAGIESNGWESWFEIDGARGRLPAEDGLPGDGAFGNSTR